MSGQSASGDGLRQAGGVHVIGIDPAPVKPVVTFDGSEFEPVEPADMRGWLDQRLREQPNTLIAWDAPLAFDPTTSFYSRAVDKKLAAAARDEPSINTAHFANLSHWAITCHVLGFPFGEPPRGLQLVDAMPETPNAPLLIEVHPAFAVFLWWRSAAAEGPVPPYKRGGRAARLGAAERLLAHVGSELRGLDHLQAGLACGGVPADDLLDAVVAYEVGCRFVERTTETVGSLAAGFIVLLGERG